jgi:hypothetical protein
MPNEDSSRPTDQVGSTFFHQSWPIAGGSMMIQIRTNRPLIDGEYVELGKVVGELERLAGMLSWVDPGKAATDADA